MFFYMLIIDLISNIADIVPQVKLSYGEKVHYLQLAEFLQLKLQKWTHVGPHVHMIPYNWIVDVMIQSDSSTICKLKQVFTDTQIQNLPRYSYRNENYTNFSPKVLMRIIKYYESPDTTITVIRNWVRIAELIADNPDYLDTSDRYRYSQGNEKAVYFLKDFVRFFAR